MGIEGVDDLPEISSRSSEVPKAVLDELFSHALSAAGYDGEYQWTLGSVSLLDYRALKMFHWANWDISTLAKALQKAELIAQELNDSVEMMESQGRKDKIASLVEEKAMEAVTKLGYKGVEFQQ